MLDARLVHTHYYKKLRIDNYKLLFANAELGNIIIENIAINNNATNFFIFFIFSPPLLHYIKKKYVKYYFLLKN